VPDHDTLGSDEHLPDEQANPLALRDGSALGCLPQTHQKAFEVLRELEIRLPVHRLCFQRPKLGTQGRNLFPQLRHPAAKFFQCDQLLLVGLDEALDGAFGAPELTLQGGFLYRDGACGPQLLQTAFELCTDELGSASKAVTWSQTTLSR
jgi:hypothetical protein